MRCLSRQKKQLLIHSQQRSRILYGITGIQQRTRPEYGFFAFIQRMIGEHMEDNYESFKKSVFELTQIDLNAYKERQMKRRIDTIISKHGYKCYSEFVTGLKTNPMLFEEFVNYLTINVSEFYRNPEQWKYLEDKVFPELIHKFGHGIRIWSAACSTGDEPYSLVMLLSKFLPLNQIKIIATDIDEQVITKAKTGLYKAQSLNSLPEEFKTKYFEQVAGESYRISDDIKKCVEFRKHNLLKDEYPKGCHMIVCRNVLIYFTDEAKQDIYRKFYNSLVDEGILFVGSTEQITNYKELNFVSPKSFFYLKK